MLGVEKAPTHVSYLNHINMHIPSFQPFLQQDCRISHAFKAWFGIFFFLIIIIFVYLQLLKVFFFFAFHV